MIQNGNGGANTNKHGLRFEANHDLAECIASDLSTKYELIPDKIHKPLFRCSEPKYILKSKRTKKPIAIVTKQNQFYNVLYQLYGLHNINSKRWKPDECLFNLRSNTVYIIEKKWQNEAGSVDEKLFGFVNKRRLYQRLLNQAKIEPKPEVHFAALFNSQWWLNGNDGKNASKYEDYFNCLRLDGIEIFFNQYRYRWFEI